MSRLRSTLLAVVLLAGCGPSNREAEEDNKDKKDKKPAPKVELKAVKYDELTRAIRGLRGKIVVVDLWASWCGPCKEEFPHLVALHRKYAPEGVECVSVALEMSEKGHPKALEFLTQQKATFPNYRLDEELPFAFEKFDLKGIPAVFVFDRDGKRAAKFTRDDPNDQFNYDTHVVPFVRKLLAAKK